ncbi:MAG TPA: site-specific integrase [Symbiobacteriaceae bacterium]|nr:site-specific integrase [Symbiobacteriaceae bacterium]
MDAANYYATLTVNGLHYVYHRPKDPEIADDLMKVALAKPDHSTHKLATAYLLHQLYSDRADKTVYSKAQHLKKFYDFLSFWDIDLAIIRDPMTILVGFVDYLRLIQSSEVPAADPSDRKTPSDVVLWAAVEHVPLHDVALGAVVAGSPGKVVPVGEGPRNKLVVVEWGEYPKRYIARCVHTVVEHMQWLQRHAPEYANYPVRLIPMKTSAYGAGSSSSTSGSVLVDKPDIENIVQHADLNYKQGKPIRPVRQSRMLPPRKADYFEMAITKAQDRFLFFIMRYFGLRASEVAGLRIEVKPPLEGDDDGLRSLPRDFSQWTVLRAKRFLKERLGGDIELVDDGLGDPVWQVDICESKTLAGQRKVPFLREWGFPQDKFLHLLYDAIVEREFLMHGTVETDHGLMFVSQHHAHRGTRLTGVAVAQKFNAIAARATEDGRMRKRCDAGATWYNLKRKDYSPHSFRHLFATELLVTHKMDSGRVSLLMGHKDRETTETTYIHFLQRHLLPKGGTVKAMAKKFGEVGRSLREAVAASRGLRFEDV